jgi:hypothetical protein
MPYIFKKKSNGEIIISSWDNQDADFAFTQKTGKAFYEQYYEYGFTSFMESEYFDIDAVNHTVSYYHNNLQRMCDEGHIVLESTQKVVDNEIVDKTDSELLADGLITQAEYDYGQSLITESEWINIRAIRDTLLRETDFTRLDDATENDLPMSASRREQYRLYRLSLRTITKDFNNPFEVVFPIKP